MNLSGKVAIVTGGASGIGRATALLLASRGAAVLVADILSQEAADVARQIRKDGGLAESCRVDVSVNHEVESMIGAATKAFGGLDILVNCAAVQIVASLDETTEEMWETIHRVNLKGVFLSCKHAVPPMLKRGGGAIVNVGSVLGIVADPALAAYCAAKGGVLSLSRVAALTYGPNNIRVNCICPGDVETPLVQAYFDSAPDPDVLRREVSGKYALRRIASPQEIAKAIAFLVSEESSFLTGSSIVVDGGLTVKCY
jgi:NAD(P)-dependent dehydrogenase (short-subunit alcohol dehydrogenase family)